MYEHLTILWMGIVKAILYMAKYPDTCYLNLWGDYKCGINHTFPGEANDKDNDMVKFLRQHPQITHLRVNKKYNESTILPCVLDMVIKVIRANIPSLTHMNLRYVKLTISELSLIVEALKENNSIVYFNVMNNNIGDIGASIIADLLVHNNSIKTMFLNNNNITDDGAVEIAKSLKINNCLTDLDLGYNRIRFDGALETIITIANYNRELQSLQIDNNNFGNNCYDMLYFMLASSLTLQRVSICSCMFDNMDRNTTSKRNCEFFTNTYWNVITHTIFGSKIHKFIYYILLCNQRRGMLGNITLNNDLLILLFDNLNLKRTLYIEECF